MQSPGVAPSNSQSPTRAGSTHGRVRPRLRSGVFARVHGEMRRVRVRLELLCGPAFSHEFSCLVQFFIWPRAAPVSHALADARRGARGGACRPVCVCRVCAGDAG